jgi:deoxyadenosine/deoxycytidine kinase
MNNKKQLISIEGNIGAGKSTFVNIIKNNVPNTEIVSEPIEIWKKTVDADNENILDKFYKNIPRWAYTFQNFACITRMMKIEDTLRETTAELVFLDRSLATDKYIFEKMLHDGKQISELEHNIYNLWCDFYYKYVRPELENITIYLRCNPLTALERIKKRGRTEEQNISISYLTDLHNYHEKWLMENNEKSKSNVIVINTDKDFENDEEYQKEIINNVLNEINLIKQKKLMNINENIYNHNNVNYVI